MTTFTEHLGFLRTGIALALYPTETDASIEIQRAPDDSGSPDVGAAVTIAVVPPGPTTYVDYMGRNAGPWHYRTRHTDGYATDSEWTSWVAATPVIIPDPLPPIPLVPALDFDLFIDPLTGEITLYVDASADVDYVKWDCAINSGTFPDATAGTQQALTDGSATIVVPLGTYQADPGDEVKAAVAFYRGGGQLVGTLRRAETMPIYISANPTWDFDGADLYLYPNRSEAALGGYWKVYTSGTPTKADVLATGTLSTLDEILVHTFTADGEAIQVAFVPTAGADGSGATGQLWARPFVFDADAVRPEAWEQFFISTTPKHEGVILWGRDPGEQVRIRYRQYAVGDTPPSFSDSGLGNDPRSVTLDVERPDDGDPNVVIEFYAENASGWTSNDPSAPRRVIVDANIRPSGTAKGDLNRSTGEPKVLIATSDPDTFSWRMRVSKSSYPTIAYSDVASDEFSGTFPGSPSLSAFKLAKGEILYCTIIYYRTAATAAASQNSSIKSPTDSLLITQAEETENKIRNAAITPIPEWANFVYLLSCHVGANTRSVEIAWSYTAQPSGLTTAVTYYEDVTPGDSFANNLRGSQGGAQVLIPAYVTDLSVTLTPYDATGGSGGGGNDGMPISLGIDSPAVTGSGVALSNGTDVVRGPYLVTGSGIARRTVSDVIYLDAKPSDFIVIQASDPSGSWGASDAGKIWVQP